MNDDETTPDLSTFDPPLTPDTLRAECDEHFTAAGVAFYGEVEGPWYNDETLPWTFAVHDENHDVWINLDMNGEWTRPAYVTVLMELFGTYSDFDVKLEQLPTDIQGLLLEAKAAVMDTRALETQGQATALLKLAADYRAQLAALQPTGDLAAALAKTFNA